MASSYEAEIVVIGAGLVGLSAAISLAQAGTQVVLVDAKKYVPKQTKHMDTRVYAITPAIESWLTNLDVWSELDRSRVTDVEAMRIWSEDNASPLNLSADDANLAKVASIIENNNLLNALWQRLKSLDVEVLSEHVCQNISHAENKINLLFQNGSKLKADLLVAADGGDSFVRKVLNIPTKTKMFKQTAIVANFIAEKSHQHIARQWFAKHNTLAMLPMSHNVVSMVWSMSTELAEKLLTMSGSKLSSVVEKEVSHELGQLECISKSFPFELRQMTASQLIAERVVFVGDAAHQIHPMAGQGVNLGFRDVIALQGQISSADKLHDIGEHTFLRKHERARKADILGMNSLTSGLDYWFANDALILKKLTQWGLHQVDTQASIKKVLINQAVV